MTPDAAEPLGLKEQLENTLSGASLVLPGVQALFGFQFIAIFQDPFTKVLTPFERTMHFASILLSSLAIVLIIAPASLHRSAEPERASKRLIVASGRLLSASLWVLALGAACEFRVLARLVYRDAPDLAWLVATGVLALYLGFWKLAPLIFKRGKGETEEPGEDERTKGG